MKELIAQNDHCSHRKQAKPIICTVACAWAVVSSPVSSQKPKSSLALSVIICASLLPGKVNWCRYLTYTEYVGGEEVFLALSLRSSVLFVPIRRLSQAFRA